MSKKEKEGAKDNAQKKFREIMGNINIHYFKALLFILIVTLIFMVMVELGLNTGWHLIVTAIVLVYLRLAIKVLEPTPPFGYALLRLNSFVRNMFKEIEIFEGGFKFFFLTLLLNRPLKIYTSKMIFSNHPNAIGKPFTVIVRTPDGSDSDVEISSITKIVNVEKFLESCDFNGKSIETENYLKVQITFQDFVTRALREFARSKQYPRDYDELMDCGTDMKEIIMADKDDSPKNQALTLLGIKIVAVNIENIELHKEGDEEENEILLLKEKKKQEEIRIEIERKKKEQKIVQAEGDAEATKIRAQGEADATKIKLQADTDAARTLQEDGKMTGKDAQEIVLANKGAFSGKGTTIRVEGGPLEKVVSAVTKLIGGE